MDPQKNLLRDHFSRLPDHVILEIFTYLDLKSLRRNTSISKFFSRLVPLTPAVSLSLPNPCVPSRYETLLIDLFKDLLFSVSSTPRSTVVEDEDERVGVIILSGPVRIVPITQLIEDSKCSLIHEKLKDFTKIQTLFIDLIDADDVVVAAADHDDDDVVDDDDESGLKIIDDSELDFLPLDFTSPDRRGRLLGGMIKWKAIVGKAGIESCYILGTARLDRVRSGKCTDDALLFPLTKDKKQQQMVLSWANYCIETAWLMQAMLKDVIRCHPTVEDAVLNDTTPKGKVLFKKGSILNGLTEQNLQMKLWYIAELELPQSGYVMKGATFVSIKPNHDNDDDAGRLIEEAFGNDDDDDGEYGVCLSEFVTEMRMPMESSSVRLEKVFNFPSYFM